MQIQLLYQLSKNRNFKMDDIRKQCIDKIKEVILSNLVLKAYDPSLPVELICDIPPTGIARILQQKGRPVIIMSKALTVAKQNMHK